jgi:hypothetical protein
LPCGWSKDGLQTFNKTGKRKRNCIDTYNDLNEGALVKNDEESSGVEVDQEDWVSKNVFLV